MSLIETKEVKFYTSVEDFPKSGNELCVADGSVYVVSGGISGKAGSLQFQSLTDFTAAGGPAAYGTGPVWIAGQQYWCNGISLVKVGGYAYSASFNATITDTTSGAGGGAGSGLQMGVITVPGGIMTSTSIARIEAIFTSTSTVGAKDTQVRIGPASGTFATATLISGQSGLTTQKFAVIDARVANLGSTASQRATPYNISIFTSSGNTPIATSIDTSLDWNIYFAGMVATISGTNLTLENATVEIVG